MVTMKHNPNPQFRKAHLTNLNNNNFKMIEFIGLKINGIEVPLNVITFVQNFIKFYQAVQKLLVGDRQTSDLISLLSFL
jgi:hypothetical protein